MNKVLTKSAATGTNVGPGRPGIVVNGGFGKAALHEITGNGLNIRGNIEHIRGDVSNLRGDVSGLYGCVTGLSGDATGVRGRADGLSGNLDTAGITAAQRQTGFPITLLII